MHVARQHKSVGWRLTGVGLERGNESLAAPHIAAITGLSADDNQVITAATRTRQANEQKRKAELAAVVSMALPPGLHVG